MAAISPKTGAVSLPSGFAMDVQQIDLDESEPTEDTTYFGLSGNYSTNKGSGTLTQVITCTGFANATATGVGAVGGDGAAATFTFSSGRAASGTYIVRRKTITGARTRATVGATLELVNNGAITMTA